MRYSNFKNQKGSSISISINKKNEVETNLFGKNQVIKAGSTADDLKKIFNELNPRLKAIDPNNRILKNENDLKKFEVLFNTTIKNAAEAGFINCHEIYKVQVVESSKIQPAVKKQKAATENAPVETPKEKQQEAAPVESSSNEETTAGASEAAPSQDIITKRVESINDLSNIFKDVNFNAIKSNRFINTLSKKEDLQEAAAYVCNYAKLENHPDADHIVGLTQSPEFKRFFNNFKKLKTNKIINSRLMIYYGDAGTGKTTKAIKDNPSAAVVLCNNSMTSAELFEEFTFENGAPVYKDSAFMRAIKEGQKIILDEINLCNDEVLRALQTLSDNKQYFNYKGQKIEIKDGFQIIGTMNLTVNGYIYALPEPLVDRAGVIQEFTLNVENLALRAF